MASDQTTTLARSEHEAGAVTPMGPGPRSLVGTRRPVRALLGYYALQSILAGPGIVVLLPLRWFRYHTLRYDFDADGVTMRWGILFRRAVTLTYARIQDIHLVSNIVERWLGLGRVQIQTASGNAAAELTIEGLPDYQQVRDELYIRMRGARGDRPAAMRALSSADAEGPAGSSDVAAALQDAVRELRMLRETLAERNRA